MSTRKSQERLAASTFAYRLARWVGAAAALALAGCLALAPAPAWAVPPDCSDGENEPLKACEEKLNNAQGELLDELDLLIGEMETTPEMRGLGAMKLTDEATGETTTLGEQMAKLKRQHGRAQEALGETTNQDFEDLLAQSGKEKGEKCVWKESAEVVQRPADYLPAGLSDPSAELGNGDCDSFSAYDEDKQRTLRVNERSQPNVCVRVCEDKEVPGQAGAKIRDHVRRRHIEQQSESIDATLTAAAAVRQAREDVRGANAVASVLGPRQALALSFPECELPSNVPHVATWATKGVLVVIQVALKIATRVAEGIKEGALTACQQDIAGFNGSAVCITFIVIHQVLQGTVDVSEFLIQATDLVNQGFSLFTADATHACIKSIRAEQSETLTIVQGLEAKMGSLEELLKRLLLENREYIKNVRTITLTPHGQRSRVRLYEAPAP